MVYFREEIPPSAVHKVSTISSPWTVQETYFLCIVVVLNICKFKYNKVSVLNVTIQVKTNSAFNIQLNELKFWKSLFKNSK